ncbi:MAG: YgfZ/GcvT domain-containing protein [Legionella sp.]
MNTIYSINKRNFEVQSSLDDELFFATDKNYLFDLSYLSVINVSGTMSDQFLQGQLTCDVREINRQSMRPGLMCNLKGRILVITDIINWQGFQLIVPQDLCELTIHSLTKTAKFSNVTLHQEHSYHLFGFYHQNVNDCLPFPMLLPEQRFSVVATDTYCCYALGNNYYILLIDNQVSSQIINAFTEKGQLKTSLAWQYRQLQQQRFEIYPESRGLFLPHRMNLHVSGHISFDKGCYKGQEIIARTHFLAKTKHKIIVIDIKSEKLLYSGMPILDKNDHNQIGELIDYCPIGDQVYLIGASILTSCRETDLCF